MLPREDDMSFDCRVSSVFSNLEDWVLSYIRTYHLQFPSHMPRVLCQVNGTLKILTLTMNGLSSKGARSLGDALLTNCTLAHLDVSANRIHDDGAIALARGLAHNDTLETLVVSRVVVVVVVIVLRRIVFPVVRGESRLASFPRFQFCFPLSYVVQTHFALISLSAVFYTRSLFLFTVSKFHFTQYTYRDIGSTAATSS